VIDPKALQIIKALRTEPQLAFSNLLRTVKNPRTLSSKLQILLGMGLLEKKQRLYSLTEKGKEVAALLERIELALGSQPLINVDTIPHPTFRAVLKRFCEDLLNHYGDNLIGLLLFGSVAIGKWGKDSDIDLLVVLRTFKRNRRETMRELLEIRGDLKRTQEYQDSVAKGYYPIIEIYPLELEESKRFRRMYLDALTEGIVIFERESFLTNLIREFEERLRKIGARRIEMPGVGHYWVLGNLKAGEVLDL